MMSWGISEALCVCDNDALDPKPYMNPRLMKTLFEVTLQFSYCLNLLWFVSKKKKKKIVGKLVYL